MNVMNLLNDAKAVFNFLDENPLYIQSVNRFRMLSRHQTQHGHTCCNET